MEKTLIIVKPNAFENAEQILMFYEYLELKIVSKKTVRLTKEQAEEFYQEHKGESFFADLVTFMTSGPCLFVVLEGEDAISKARSINGDKDPTKAEGWTIRRLFGETVRKNAVHGSADEKSAEREVAFFDVL